MATLSSTDVSDGSGPNVREVAQARYSAVAILLHWAIALALAFQIALGFAMPKTVSGFALMQLHKSVGITILLLSLARLGWRLTHRPPPAVEGEFQGFLAKAVHTLLYIFMIGGPLTGWAIVSTARVKIPTLLFGTVPWPHLPLPAALNEPMEGLHGLIAWIGLALIVLHLAGALRHQLLIKDGLLRRMAPGGSVAAVFALAALVLAVYFGTGMKIAGDVMKAGGYGLRPAPASTVQAASPALARPAPDVTATPTAEPSATPTPEASATAAAADPGPPPTWAIQRGGRLGFAVDNGSSAIRGTFSDWTGAITFNPDLPETADLRITVKLASASLGDSTQDEMLQGSDFFGSAASPTATWRSTSVRQTAPGRYSANGTLSLKGMSKPQTVTFTLTGKDLKRHVAGSATIDRSAFGIGAGEAAEGLAKSVTLNFAFDAAGRAP